jgi:hypothetical protein
MQACGRGISSGWFTTHGSAVVQYTDSVVPSLLIWRLLQEVVPFLESVVEVHLSLVTSFRPGVVVEYSPRQPAQLD